VPFAQRAICERGSPGGPGGCAPGPHPGFALPPPTHFFRRGVDTGRLLWSIPHGSCVVAGDCSQPPDASLSKHCVARGSLVLRLAKQHYFCLGANSELHRLPHHRGDAPVSRARRDEWSSSGPRASNALIGRSQTLALPGSISHHATAKALGFACASRRLARPTAAGTRLSSDPRPSPVTAALPRGSPGASGRGLTFTPPARSISAPAARAITSAIGAARTPAVHRRSGGDPLGLLADRHCHSALVDVRDHGVLTNGDAELGELPGDVGRGGSTERRCDPFTRLEQDHSRGSRVDPPKVSLHGAAERVRELT